MKNVESFYPLSPMQQGMLFHSLAEPDSGMYIEFASVALQGELDREIFGQVWQTVIQRHSILRTSFVWENVKEPVQVVQLKVALPLQYLDWREIAEPIQVNLLAEYHHKEINRGFDLSKSPLMRLTLIQTQEQKYQFIWTYHHILLDGWSIPLLLQEVMGLYTARKQGVDFQLPLARPFREYILWLKRQNLAESEAYWRRKLAGFTAPTPLVVTRLKKELLASEPEFSDIEIDLSREMTRNLQSLARSQQVTLNTIIQAAWAILLGRYSGEEEVVFGVTVSGRPADLPGSDEMLGLFINTLPFHIRVVGDMGISNLLKEIQAGQAEMRQFEYTPLVQIQGWSDVPRGTALFESILVFENFPISGLDSGGQGSLGIKAGVFASHTNFPLTLVATPDEEFSLKISYDRRLFDPETIQRMLGHLRAILGSMIHELAQTVSPTLSRLKLITEEEINQLRKWNKTEKAYPASGTIHEWFEKQVEKSPFAIAVSYTDPTTNQRSNLSYQELNQRANLLAHYLRNAGVNAESMVGVLMERNIQLLVAILGILKAGGAYVPLDPTYPKDRLAFIIEDFSSTSSGPTVILSQDKLAGEIDQARARVLKMDTDWGLVASQAREIAGVDQEKITGPENQARPENMAYVIYTSGSTGKPKGVMVTHANVVRLFEATQDWYGFNAHDVWTLFHSYAFDFSVWEIWGAFLYGGRLVVVPYEISRSPDQFYQLLVDEQVTILNQTPSAFHQLMLAEERQGASPKLALRKVIFGGEALNLPSLRPWFDRHGDDFPQLINMYGITETTVHVTYRPIFYKDLDAVPGSMIGRAIPDLEIHILDPYGSQTPVGIPGELYVGGAGVARGYLNRPELTEERFVRDLFDTSQTRIYRTGDLARYLPDGDIEYLGRIDHQVKIRGFRIELGEIENVLVGYPNIREAVVLLRKDAAQQALVAYLVQADPSHPVDLVDLRRSLLEKLPEYMTPAYYLILDALPLTGNGKVDQRALLALPITDKSRLVGEADYRPPQTEAQIEMARLWSQLLGLERVGLDDNFFSLGGDSILSIQLISRAKQAGFNIGYRQIFENPSLEKLVASTLIEVATTSEIEILGDKGLPDLAVREAGYPLTPVQHWFFEHHQEKPERFNTSILLQLAAPLDRESLFQALEKVILLHPALRLSFTRSGSQWSQSLSDALVAESFLFFDIMDIEESAQAEWIAQKSEQIQGSFQLDQPPLLRLAYFACGAGQNSQTRKDRLLVVFHHLVSDGVSIRIFVEDIVSAYIQQLAGVAQNQGVNFHLPGEGTSFLEWTSRLESYAQSAELVSELGYWDGLASMATSRNQRSSIPVDHPDGQNTYGLVDHLTHFISQSVTDSLVRRMPARFAISVQAVLLSALVKIMALWTGAPALWIETEGHGREEIPGTALGGVDLSRTMGWFTSLYPLYLEIDAKAGPLEAAVQVEQQIRKVPHRGVGFGVLKYLSKNEAFRTRMQQIPAPEINFNYLGQFDQSGSESSQTETALLYNSSASALIEVSAESSGQEQDPACSRSARLYLVASVSGGQLGFRWLYSRGLHRRETVMKFAQLYQEELERMAGLVEQ